MDKEKVFLDMFDEVGSDIIDSDGMISEELVEKLTEFCEDEEWYEEVVLYTDIGKVLEDKTVANGDHHVEMEAILQVGDRFFRVCYDGIGKDLDEYVDYEIVEVVPKEVVKTIYVKKENV